MYLLPPLTDGRILRRYKRFLADVELEDGRRVTAHCANTGAMTSCWAPGAPVQLSFSNSTKRKLAWTLERVDMGCGWVGVNTARVNGMIARAIELKQIPQLSGYQTMQSEPWFEDLHHPRSRLDLLLSDGRRADAYVEIKNVTLLENEAIMFPDAVTVRGRKHLELLGEAVKMGFRGVIVFALNRPEGKYFQPAGSIDPEYANTLQQTLVKGVEIVIVRLKHLTQGVIVAGSASSGPAGLTSTQ